MPLTRASIRKAINKQLAHDVTSLTRDRPGHAIYGTNARAMRQVGKDRPGLSEGLRQRVKRAARLV